jgi:hypothetical protein
MRWLCVLVLFLAGCTSIWERHQTQLADYEARGEYARATAEMRWQIDNAFYHAPPRERTAAAEAARYVRLAKLAVQAGDLRLAIKSLRDALTTDPSQAAAVRAQLDKLPISAAKREQLREEFAWNTAALAPADAAFLTGEPEDTACWSYRVREVQIRHRRIIATTEGRERQITYDARAWLFDALAGQWHVDGGWMRDVGTEVELVDGPAQPRYRALATADHQFYADAAVPPCHRAQWHGPFDPAGTIFVAAQLPERAPEANP